MVMGVDFALKKSNNISEFSSSKNNHQISIIHYRQSYMEMVHNYYIIGYYYYHPILNSQFGNLKPTR